MATCTPPSPDSASDTPPRPRRWIPVSVRLLVLLVPFLGIVGFTWIAVRAYTNAVVINEIERLGGEVRTRSCAPEWLQRHVSDDWAMPLDDIVSVTLLYGEVSDEWLARLKCISNLEDLWLYGPSITDAGLEHLKGFKNLRSLGLRHTLVTGSGIKELSGMTNLEFLSLSGTKVGDACLPHLSGLHNLRSLNLAYTDVTDEGLAHLEGLTGLETLRLAYLSSETLAFLSSETLAFLSSETLADLPSETEDRFAELRRARPELKIENDLFIMSHYWPPRGHSPRFFASAALLMTGAVVIWLLGLAYVLPLAVVKLSAWYTSRCRDRSEARPSSRAVGVLSVRFRRVLRFSRAAGVLFVVAAAFLVAMPIVRQQMAVHAVERLGGWFENRVKYPDGPTPLPVSGLQHLGRLISVQELTLSRNDITDRDLSHLKRLPTLQVLWVYDTPISDAALEHLRGLADLRELHLRNTRVTDAGVRVMKCFGRLETLDLNDTQVTDAGIVQLAELATLKDLRLSNTALTDAGLAHLGRLTKLTWLDLEGTGVTDSGLSHLAKLTELKYLDLSNAPQVTGTGIEHLKGLKNLETLSLDGKQFAHGGVESLQQLKNLKSLSIAGTQMSEADIDELKRVLPDVYVSCEK